eukprot:g2913.t1
MNRREGEGAWVAGLSGSIAGSVAEALTLPLDTMKVRMQINRSAAGSTTMLHVGRSILSDESARGFFKGFSPAIWRQVIYQGLKMFLYEPVRDVAMSTVRWGHDDVGSGGAGGGGKLVDLALRFVTGGTVGALGTIISSPTDMMKVRMQADVDGSRYGGKFIRASLKVANKEGVLAFWKGSFANVQRSFVVNASELATYDASKNFIVNDLGWDSSSIVTQALCALNAGFVAALTSTPVDLAKTRLMNAGDGNKTYRGIFDCMRQTAAKEGLGALYKGFFPNWFRMAPWTLAFFLTFEKVRPTLAEFDALSREGGNGGF